MKKYYFVHSSELGLEGKVGQHPSKKIQVYLTEENARQACTSNENSVFSLVLEPTLGLIEEEEGQFFLNCSKISPEGLGCTCLVQDELVAGPSESMEVDEFGSMVATDTQPVASSSRVIETDSHSMEFDTAEKGALPSGPVFGPSSSIFENDELDDRLLSSQGQTKFDFKKTVKAYLRNTKGLTDVAIGAYTQSMAIGKREYRRRERASYMPSAGVSADISTPRAEVLIPHTEQVVPSFDQITDTGIIRAINLLRCLDRFQDEASKDFMLFAVLAYDYSWKPGNGELRDQLFAAYKADPENNTQDVKDLTSDNIYQHFCGNPEEMLNQLEGLKAAAKHNEFLSPLLNYNVKTESARKKECLEVARMIGKTLSLRECNISSIKRIVDTIHEPRLASSIIQKDSHVLEPEPAVSERTTLLVDAVAQPSNIDDQAKFDFKETIKNYLGNTKGLTNAAIKTYALGAHTDIPEEAEFAPYAKEAITPFDQVTDAGIIRAINLLRCLDIFQDEASKKIMLFAVLAYDYSWKPGNGELRDQIFAAYKADPESNAQDMEKLAADDVYQHFCINREIKSKQLQDLKVAANHNRFFSPSLDYYIAEQNAMKKECLELARLIGKSLSIRECNISSINEAVERLRNRSPINQQQPSMLYSSLKT